MAIFFKKKDDKAALLRQLDIPLDRQEDASAAQDTPEYDLDALLAGVNPENVHPETLTGRAVGNEFA
jgi:hypothetical protein